MDANDALRSLGLIMLAVEVAVCLLALYRRLWERLPLFTGYLVLVAAADLARLIAYDGWGARSAAYGYTYWSTQIALVFTRGAALADVCRAALEPYRGVWHLTRWLLIAVCAAMLTLAALRTQATTMITSYLIFVERELEFVIVVSLLALLVLSRYYGVMLDRPLGGIAMGLAFYASVVITTSSIITGPVAMPWWAVSLLRTAAFAGALGFWAYALRMPLPETAAPVLGTVEAYERETQMVSDRMRSLNARLLELMKR
jgi:hypothetical protein